MSKGPSPNEIRSAESQQRRRLKGAIIEPSDMASAVLSLGGVHVIVKKRKWQLVRERLNLPQTSSSGNTLYRVWKTYFPRWDGISAPNGEYSSSESEESEQESSSGEESSSSGSESSESSDAESDDLLDDDGNGNGDNGGGITSDSSDPGETADSGVDLHGSECHICNQPGELLMCDHCVRVFHTGCLKPPLKSLPEGDWMCPVCVVSKARKKAAAAVNASNKRKRLLPRRPRVEQSTFSASLSPNVASTVARLQQFYNDDEELEMWEYDLTRLMLQDRSKGVKSAHMMALVQAALDDYELSKMALDLSHTLSRCFLMVYEVGWHKPKKKRSHGSKKVRY
jgi:hypothetical protein